MPELVLPPNFPLANFLTEVSPSDAMYAMDQNYGDVTGIHYIEVALSALKIFEHAASEGFMRPEGPCDILDLPCGHGRVARVLSSRFPEARLTVCDIDRDGVEFCVSRLGANRAYSCTDFDKLDLGKSFDLIWVGSLITHLIPSDTVKLIRCMERHLAEDGLLIMSSQGQHLADYYESLYPANATVAQYKLVGYGANVEAYVNGYDGAMISRHWLEGFFAGEPCGIIEYLDHEWGGKQDILFIKRRPILPPQFDPKTYLTIHKDVAAAGFDPVHHYFLYGRKEGRRLR
jgi:SAM-dependent methyltransferase